MKRLIVALLIAAAAALLAPTTSAGAASVAPIPVPPGAQTCDSIGARFGAQPGEWDEIRFTNSSGPIPAGTQSKTANGNTVTVTITARGTVDVTSLQPVEAVYVNKGNGAGSANAIYRYVPPVLGDRDLGLLPVVLSGVDHVIVCWTTALAPTTTTTTTTTIAVAPTTAVVLPTVVRPAATTTTAAPVSLPAQLPETGEATPTLVTVAALLALSGAIAVLLGAGRQQRRPR